MPKQPELSTMMKTALVAEVDMCTQEMCDPYTSELLKKSACLYTNCPAIVHQFKDAKCRDACGRQDVRKQLNKSVHYAFPVQSFHDRRKRIDFEETELTQRQSPFQVRRQKLEAEEIYILKQMSMKRQLPTIENVSFDASMNEA